MPIPVKPAVSLAICATLGFLVTGTVRAQSPVEYPLEAVLTAARQLCTAATTVEAVARGPLPAGFKVVTPRRGSWLATYLDEIQWGTSGFTKAARASTATVRGRLLEAVVVTTHGRPSQSEATSCEVIDRTAMLSPDDGRMGRWAGRPPALGRKDYLPGLFGWTWKPGLEPASYETTVNYVADSAGKAAGLRAGLTYLAITLPRQASK